MPQETIVLSWPAVAILVTVGLALLSGFRVIAQIITRVDQLEETADRLTNQQATDMKELRGDIADMRKMMHEIWREVATK